MNDKVRRGDRIRMIRMADEKYHPVPCGAEGKVKKIERCTGSFWVDWEGFSNNLKVLPDADTYEVFPKKVLCFDLETTGLDTGSAEILQFAAVMSSGEEESCINELYRPVHVSEWSEAEKVNGISPSDVKGKYPFECEENLSRLQKLFDEADEITGYNIAGYDLPIIRRYGIRVPEEKVSELMGRFVSYMKNTFGSAAKDRYKLREAATLAGMTAEDGAFHDAMYDARITMSLYDWLEERDEDII